MIKVDNISKQFLRNIRNDSGKKSFGKKTKEEFYAVNGVSFEAKAGEILGILGPNGAGKTTLLRMLASLMTPNDGTVEIYDSQGNIIEDSVDKKKHIGYLSGMLPLAETMQLIFLDDRSCGLSERRDYSESTVEQNAADGEASPKG